MTDEQIFYIAEKAHEILRAYCEIIGDVSQVQWKNAPEWQKTSAANGVRFVLSNSNFKPSDSHEHWRKEKIENGWKYGVTKDPEKKTNPCMLPFDQLPEAQRVKDYLFISVVRALALQ